MGDISTEPSMEDILSSIKRIIAEEGDGVTRARRSGRTPPPPTPAPFDVDEEEILELNDSVAAPEPVPQPRPVPQAPQPAPPQPTPAIVSREAEQATRAPLEALSRLIVKPETPGSDTLEALVRELLRPIFREWLDANLPQIVEAMVAREISRITSQG